MEQFESDMSDTYNIFNELETILYKIGDARLDQLKINL